MAVGHDTLHAFTQAALRHLQHAHALVRRHPRRLGAGVLLGLGGFGVTAFGIAPMAPDAATLPKQVVVEAVELAGLSAQAVELALHPLELHRVELTRASDTADTLLRRLGAADPAAAAFLRRDPLARRLLDGQAGKLIDARLAPDGTLLSLVARYGAADTALASTHFTRLSLHRDNGQFSSQIEQAELSARPRLGSGRIRSTLWAATDLAQLPDGIASQLIEIFSTEVDFHRELRRGDSFSVWYEELTADGQAITWGDAVGRILAAEFVNGGKTHQAVWFPDASHSKGGAYFSPDGKSRQRSFLASPLEFSRVSSGFAERFHPILQSWRAHNGVDYSAPEGTPVKTVGDGVVEFAGRQSGYGNVVQVDHGGNKSTLYAHLSRIDVSQGQRVRQGDLLGAVGATGWATGPHLHFEVRINGQFQDPLTLSKESATRALDPAAKAQFASVAALAVANLDAAESMTAFRANAE